MLTMKTVSVGVLVAAASLAAGGSCRAGIITAGSSGGTLYFGGSSPSYGYGISNWGAGTTVIQGGSVPYSLFAPPAAYVPPTPPPTPPPAAPVVAYQPPVVVAPIAAAAPAPSVTMPAVAAPTPPTQYDAFINFGTAPYADQAILTTGTAQSWTTSPSLVTAFGHVPTTAELNTFSQTVLARVESTFQNSGLSITATTDPTANAAHTLSVVSGLSAQSSPDAVGITRLGHNGFDFIDKLGYANSPDQLEWAVAHNVSHELMHAFGGEHHTTPDGNNLDAPVSSWSVLTDPNTTFSAASVAEMTNNIRNGGLVAKYGLGAEMLGNAADGQELIGQPVPEPATLALWGVAAGVVVMLRKRAVSRRLA